MIGYENEKLETHPNNVEELTQMESSLLSIKKSFLETIHEQVGSRYADSVADVLLLRIILVLCCVILIDVFILISPALSCRCSGRRHDIREGTSENGRIPAGARQCLDFESYTFDLLTERNRAEH